MLGVGIGDARYPSFLVEYTATILKRQDNEQRVDNPALMPSVHTQVEFNTR